MYQGIITQKGRESCISKKIFDISIPFQNFEINLLYGIATNGMHALELLIPVDFHIADLW